MRFGASFSGSRPQRELRTRADNVIAEENGLEQGKLGKLGTRGRLRKKETSEGPTGRERRRRRSWRRNDGKRRGIVAVSQALWFAPSTNQLASTGQARLIVPRKQLETYLGRGKPLERRMRDKSKNSDRTEREECSEAKGLRGPSRQSFFLSCFLSFFVAFSSPLLPCYQLPASTPPRRPPPLP